MIRRLGPAVVGVALLLAGLTAFAALAAPSNADGEAAIVLPSGTLAGTVEVTLNVAAATYPYLEVSLGDDDGDGSPANAGTTAPIQNLGAGTSMSIDTWGLEGLSDFQVLGCATATCTTSQVAGAAQATVAQPDPGSATISAPTTTFLYPDQGAPTVTGSGAGGPLAWGLGFNGPYVGRTGSLHPDEPSAVDLSGLTDNSVHLLALDCGSYDTGSNGVGRPCSPIASQPISFVSVVRALASDGNDELSTDPSLYGSTFWALDDGPTVPYTSTWSLADSAGTTVVPSTPVTDYGTTSDGTGWVSLDPEVAAEGDLPQGDYTLTLTNTVTVDGETRSGSTTETLHLLDDPPASAPQAPVALDRTIRVAPAFDASMSDLETTFTEQAIEASAGPTVFRVRNSRGQVVYTSTSLTPTPRPPGESDSTYVWHWTGYSTRGRLERAGVYHASATIPDHDGRPVEIQLGAIHDFGTRSVTHAWSAPRVSLVRGRDGVRTSRTFTVRVPGHLGTLDDIVAGVRATAEHVVGDRVHDVPCFVSVQVPAAGRVWRGTRGTMSPAPNEIDAELANWDSPEFDAARPITDPRSVTVRIRVTLPHGGSVKISHLGVHSTWWQWQLP